MMNRAHVELADGKFLSTIVTQELHVKKQDPDAKISWELRDDVLHVYIETPHLASLRAILSNLIKLSSLSTNIKHKITQ